MTDNKHRFFAHESTGETTACPECGGSGQIETTAYKGRCIHCGGIGKIVVPDRMDTKHTPGPWRAKPGGESVLAGTGVICRTPTPDSIERLANARLIAAAPGLLEALLACLPDLEHYTATHGPGPDTRLASAKAAIAKALGQS